MPSHLLARLASLAVFFVANVPGTAAYADSTVTTGAFFYQYQGPVGAPIYAGTPPYRDPGNVYSMFQTGIDPAIRVDPQSPYPGYEDPSFAGTGTATVTFPAGGHKIQFWNDYGGGPTGVNVIDINGATTTGVTYDTTTHTSSLFRLATISFTNGSWFGSSPSYDPGYGELYGESHFAFSLIAKPDPFIGSSGFGTYHVWNDTIVLNSTFGAGTPDEFSFALSPWLGSILVDEGITGSVDVWGRIGSLEAVELRNPTAGITLVSAVPEAENYAMMIAGLALVGVASRRTRHRKSGPGLSITRSA
jgi:hypothetical protein